MPHRGRSILLAAASLVLTTRAFASPSAHLVYVRDASASVCPDVEALHQAVKQRVGYDPFFPWAKTTVVVEITAEAPTFVARVRLVDDGGLSQGVRELRPGAKGCSGLIDAVALAISIALDMDVPHPDASGRAPDLDSEPASVPAPVPARVAPAPPAEPPLARRADSPDQMPASARAESDLRSLVGFDALASIKGTATVAPSVDIWAAARRGFGSLGLELRSDAPASPGSANGGTASVLFFAATAAPCVYFGPAFTCALGAVDWIHAAGSDVLVRKSGWAVVPAVGPRVGLELALTPSLALRVRGDLMINLLLPAVALNDAAIWTLPQVSGVVAVGLAYRFP